jgi:integrase
MAKAKKLPSGNWRVQVYVGKNSDGKRIYESVTASTKKEAEYMAAQVQMGKADKSGKNKISFLDAANSYIESRTNVLSPWTIASYRKILDRDLPPLHSITIGEMDQIVVQRYINRFSANHSPKTVRNVHGFISCVISTYNPNIKLKTVLPQKQKKEIDIPTEKNIYDAISGTDDDMKAIILLASQLGLRRAEISALTWADVENHMISITKTLAKNTEMKWVEKPPKTTAGTRTIPSTPAIDQALAVLRKPSSKNTDRIFSRTPDAITRKWERICAEHNFSFRFHDLRHYNASVMLALGVPDKYAMSRMGHATPTMLKTVYQHLQINKNKAFNDKINSYFDEMQHEMQHENIRHQ